MEKTSIAVLHYAKDKAQGFTLEDLIHSGFPGKRHEARDVLSRLERDGYLVTYTVGIFSLSGAGRTMLQMNAQLKKIDEEVFG